MTTLATRDSRSIELAETIGKRLGRLFTGGSATYTEQVNSISELRALGSNDVAPLAIVVNGYWSAGDGGGGMFIHDVSSTASDDGGLVIVDQSGRRWRRQVFGDNDIKFFGAMEGVNTVDARRRNHTAITAALAKGSAYMSGHYYLDRTVQSQGTGNVLRGDGMGVPGESEIGATEITWVGAGDDVVFEVYDGDIGFGLEDMTLNLNNSGSGQRANGIFMGFATQHFSLRNVFMVGGNIGILDGDDHRTYEVNLENFRTRDMTQFGVDLDKPNSISIHGGVHQLWSGDGRYARYVRLGRANGCTDADIISVDFEKLGRYVDNYASGSAVSTYVPVADHVVEVVEGNNINVKQCRFEQGNNETTTDSDGSSTTTHSRVIAPVLLGNAAQSKIVVGGDIASNHVVNGLAIVQVEGSTRGIRVRPGYTALNANASLVRQVNESGYGNSLEPGEVAPTTLLTDSLQEIRNAGTGVAGVGWFQSWIDNIEFVASGLTSSDWADVPNFDLKAYTRNPWALARLVNATINATASSHASDSVFQFRIRFSLDDWTTDFSAGNVVTWNVIGGASRTANLRIAERLSNGKWLDPGGGNYKSLYKVQYRRVSGSSELTVSLGSQIFVTEVN